MVKGNFYKLDGRNRAQLGLAMCMDLYIFVVLEERCKAILARGLLPLLTDRVRRSKKRCLPPPRRKLEPGSLIPKV